MASNRGREGERARRGRGPEGHAAAPSLSGRGQRPPLDAARATFVFVQAEDETESAVRTWGSQHAALWAVLAAAGRDVEVVVGGPGPGASGGGRAGARQVSRNASRVRDHVQRDQRAASGDVEDVVCSATILHDWNGDLNVTSYACGPFANESERTAFEHLRSRIESSLGAGDDQWILLTNLTWSVTHQFQADEIDVIAIGPPGVRVIEVKHWSRRWVDEHQDLVDRRARPSVLGLDAGTGVVAPVETAV